jgi:hypothetical protein
VAAFFAVERHSPSGRAAVWAINTLSLAGEIASKQGVYPLGGRREINKRHIDLAEECLVKQLGQAMILNVEPERLNERLSIQQGLFLFPCNIDLSFEQNVVPTFGDRDLLRTPTKLTFDRTTDTLQLSKASILKIIIPNGIHKTIIDDLYDMNVTAATLFPGLDGFARSLSYHLRIHEKRTDVPAVRKVKTRR